MLAILILSLKKRSNFPLNQNIILLFITFTSTHTDNDHSHQENLYSIILK